MGAEWERSCSATLQHGPTGQGEKEMNLYERLTSWLHPEVVKEIVALEVRIVELEAYVKEMVDKTPPSIAQTSGQQ